MVALLAASHSAWAGLSDPASAWASWLHGDRASGDWLGVRPLWEESGVEFFGNWKGSFYGLTSGGVLSPRGAFDEELTLGLTLDMGKLAGIDGLKLTGAVRYRDGRGPNAYVGASPSFSASRYQSGQNWRLMPFYFTYTTPELFGVKHLLTVSGGWQNAYTVFADQPDSKLFTNNAIGTTKGIGGNNGFPWGSSYAAWGGYLKVQPTNWFYAMSGLYMASPQASSRNNHGLYFAGYGPDPSLNGLYFLAETGVTPRFGPDRLPGKYAFGTIYWGLENEGFYGGHYDQKVTFYWQADQQIFREPGQDEKGRQGLFAFSFFNYAPTYDNVLPFYFHAGLVYQGLIPGRDADLFGIAFGHGVYSEAKIQAENAAGLSVHQTSEGVLEVDYRWQVTRFAYVQPFWQYLIRPGGTGQTANANIFGLHFGVNF
jgi:porin